MGVDDIHPVQATQYLHDYSQDKEAQQLRRFLQPMHYRFASVRLSSSLKPDSTSINCGVTEIKHVQLIKKFQSCVVG